MSGFTGSFMLGAGLNLRLASQNDQELIFQLFMESRPWLAWADASSDFIRDLYEQQFRAMRAGVESVYPDHLDFIIENCGTAAGRIIVDLGYADWRISEIQVLKKARGIGIGSNVIEGLQAAAARGNMPLTLSTPIFGSTSFPLYQRLGFQVIGEQMPMLHLAWFPPGHPAALLSNPAPQYG
ncbi:GNAT family N-acetyltransferase [Allorhizobium undicola]|uniref:GNAT family N-acetyltransferase n=1 Tax=Allorhizobium undicola TaxID=78527 RepID=UPI003D34040C